MRMRKIQSQSDETIIQQLERLEIVKVKSAVEFDRTFIFTSPPHQSVLGCSTALFLT